MGKVADDFFGAPVELLEATPLGDDLIHAVPPPDAEQLRCGRLVWEKLNQQTVAFNRLKLMARSPATWTELNQLRDGGSVVTSGAGGAGGSS